MYNCNNTMQQYNGNPFLIPLSRVLATSLVQHRNQTHLIELVHVL